MGTVKLIDLITDHYSFVKIKRSEHRGRKRSKYPDLRLVKLSFNFCELTLAIAVKSLKDCTYFRQEHLHYFLQYA